MHVLHSWLQDFIEEKLPSANDIAEKLTMHAFEVDGVEVLSDGDAIIDVDVLPNRAHDCLSHHGIAREVATLFELTFRIPPVSYKTDAKVNTQEHITFSVENSTLVPRGTVRLIKDVSVGKTPELIKGRLEKLGQRSINNIVDITNYVMLETGQPVHTFDFDKISGGKDTKTITIRGAKEGESVTTLDGKTYTLKENMLVIADENGPLDIAGVKGGADSGIDENTKHIVLSACNFNPVSVRKTSRSLGLLTDASKRFEQGITPELVERAVERASELFAQHASGHIATDTFDLYPQKRNPYMLGVSVKEVEKTLGISITKKDIADIFKRLQFSHDVVDPIPTLLEKAKSLAGAKYKYGASVLLDSPHAFDCSSFVSFLFAQVGLPTPRMTVDQFVFGADVSKENLQAGDVVFSRREASNSAKFTRVADGVEVEQKTIQEVSREWMPGTVVLGGVSHCGIYLGDGEIIHASGLWHKGEVVVERLDESPAFKTIVGYKRFLLSSEERFVVTVPSERIDVRVTEDLIEEIGRVYGYNNIPAATLPNSVSSEINKTFYYVNKVRDCLVENGYSELYLYSFAEKGDIEVKNPPTDDKKFVRTTLTTGLSKALEQGVYFKDYLGQSVVKLFEIGTVFPKKGEHFALAVAVSGVSNKTRDAELKGVAEKLGTILGEDVLGHIKDGMLEINISKCVESLPSPSSYDDLIEIGSQELMFKPFSQYPFVLRDVALWVPNEVSSLEVEKLIRDNAGELLIRTTLFDTFAKDGKTSYAFHLVFQSMEKTLSDADVEIPMKKLNNIFSEKGWEVR
ncbi:MAG: phenylalanine--tRNA ligase beta subunit-related protein [Patescibacteria group bacterium]